MSNQRNRASASTPNSFGVLMAPALNHQPAAPAKSHSSLGNTFKRCSPLQGVSHRQWSPDVAQLLLYTQGRRGGAPRNPPLGPAAAPLSGPGTPASPKNVQCRGPMPRCLSATTNKGTDVYWWSIFHAFVRWLPIWSISLKMWSLCTSYYPANVKSQKNTCSTLLNWEIQHISDWSLRRFASLDFMHNEDGENIPGRCHFQTENAFEFSGFWIQVYWINKLEFKSLRTQKHNQYYCSETEVPTVKLRDVKNTQTMQWEMAVTFLHWVRNLWLTSYILHAGRHGWAKMVRHLQLRSVSSPALSFVQPVRAIQSLSSSNCACKSTWHRLTTMAGVEAQMHLEKWRKNLEEQLATHMHIVKRLCVYVFLVGHGLEQRIQIHRAVCRLR